MRCWRRRWLRPVALSEAQLLDLTQRAHARVLAVRSGTGARVGAVWDRLAPIGDASAAEFADAAAQLVEAGQVAVSRSTSGFLRTATGVQGPTSPLSGPVLRGGTSTVEVYQRAVVTARSALAAGKTLGEALRIGRDRATSTAETDVMLAQRAQIDAWAQAQIVTAYRRVLTGNSCELCQIASTQRYWVGNLMPIHQRCDCGVAPIEAPAKSKWRRGPDGRRAFARGQVIDREFLDELKANGTADRVSAAKHRQWVRGELGRVERHLEVAQRRVEELRAELRAGISDQARETRVEERLDKWRQKVKAHEARIAELKHENVRLGPAVHQHGELGPVLTDPNHKFTGPSDF